MKMKIFHTIANVVILLGAAGLLVGVFYRVFLLSWFDFSPGAFLKFANTCLLLGIALYIRELIPAKKE